MCNGNQIGINKIQSSTLLDAVKVSILNSIKSLKVVDLVNLSYNNT